MSRYKFIDRGKGITIVFAHAFAMDHELWREQVEDLKEFNILVFDVLCHGKNQPECSEFSFEAAAADLDEILNQENIHRYILVGLSLGGYVIQEYKDSCGGGALGYVFVSCTPKFTNSYQPWELYSLKMSNLVFPFTYNPFTPFFAASSSTVTFQGYLKALARIKWDNNNLYKVWRGLTHFLEPQPIQFNGEILVICGAHDNFGTIKLHMSDWKYAYPQAQTIYVPMAGHLVNLDQPEEFNRLIRDFALQAAAKAEAKASIDHQTPINTELIA